MATKPMYADDPAMMADDSAMMADDAAMMGATPADDAAMAEGYVIEIMVKADGTFEVAKSDMKSEVEEAPSEDTMSYDSLGQALKGVMDIIKNNPISASEQSQFDAGFGGAAMAGPAAMAG